MKSLPLTRTRAPAYLSLAAGALLLAACGGGGGGDPAPTTPAPGSEIPVSATTSSAGAFTYVSGLAATGDNTAEPVVVGDVTLATSDTDEPDASI